VLPAPPHAAILGQRHAAQDVGRGLDAPADDDEIGGQMLATCQAHGADGAVALEGGNFLAGAQSDALLCMEAGEDSADHRPERFLERRVLRHYHCHGQPALAQAGRNLHPNEAGPDHDGAAGLLHGRQECVRIRSAPEQEHAPELGAGKLRRLWRAARREQSRVIGQRCAVGEAHRGTSGIDLGNLGALPLDAMARIEVGVLERCLLSALLAGQLVFAEDGAVIGEFSLLAHHHQPAAEPFPAQRLCCGLAGSAGAKNDEAALIWDQLWIRRRDSLQGDEDAPGLDPGRVAG
jgi:hypothetical protein